MNKSRSLINTQAIIAILCFFICLTSFSQTNSASQQMNEPHFNLGELAYLKINEKVAIGDSLTILLTAFSHKHALTGGPTKATAYCTISKGTIFKEIQISIHGIDNDPKKDTYDTIKWEEYTIELKNFDYDKAIEILVVKPDASDF